MAADASPASTIPPHTCTTFSGVRAAGLPFGHLTQSILYAEADRAGPGGYRGGAFPEFKTSFLESYKTTDEDRRIEQKTAALRGKKAGVFRDTD